MLVPRPADGETETVGQHSGFCGTSGLKTRTQRREAGGRRQQTNTKALCQTLPHTHPKNGVTLDGLCSLIPMTRPYPAITGGATLVLRRSADTGPSLPGAPRRARCAPALWGSATRYQRASLATDLPGSATMERGRGALLRRMLRDKRVARESHGGLVLPRYIHPRAPVTPPPLLGRVMPPGGGRDVLFPQALGSAIIFDKADEQGGRRTCPRAEYTSGEAPGGPAAGVARPRLYADPPSARRRT